MKPIPWLYAIVPVGPGLPGIMFGLILIEAVHIVLHSDLPFMFYVKLTGILTPLVAIILIIPPLLIGLRVEFALDTKHVSIHYKRLFKTSDLIMEISIIDITDINVYRYLRSVGSIYLVTKKINEVNQLGSMANNASGQITSQDNQRIVVSIRHGFVWLLLIHPLLFNVARARYPFVFGFYAIRDVEQFARCIAQIRNTQVPT